MKTEQIMQLQGRELDRAVHRCVADWPEHDYYIPTFHSSLDAIRPVIRKAIEEGLGALIDRKIMVVRMEKPPEWIWNLDPEDYCRALLIAYAERDSNVPVGCEGGADGKG